MEWNMLKESKKLFPHWLDKSDDSNFSKHLNILNNQQLDIRHKIRCIDWSRVLNKPLQIHKTQTEPYKWKMEFEVNVPRLKQVKIYKNPTIVNNTVVNSKIVVNGYYNNGNFYENHSKEITDNDFSDYFSNIIDGEDGNYYYDILTKKYYLYENNNYLEVTNKEEIPQTSLIYSEYFIDNYSHFFRHILYEDNTNSINIYKVLLDEDNNLKYKTILDYSENSNLEDIGKYELITYDDNVDDLYYDVNTKKYCIYKDNEIIIPYLYEGFFYDSGVLGTNNENSFSYNVNTTTVTSDSEGTLVCNTDTVSNRLYVAKMSDGTYNKWKSPIKVEFDIVSGDDNVKVQLFKSNAIYISRTLSQLRNPSHIKIEYDGETANYYVDGDTVPIYKKTLSIGDDFQIRFSIPIQSSIKYKNFKIYTDIEGQSNYDESVSYIIFKDNIGDSNVGRIPLIENRDITPIISNDRYVLEVTTWDDYHFLKGFPEIDFIDYNNNNIIDFDERNYDNLSISIEKISNKEYLTFRVHQYGIKLIEIFKDDKPIHSADFVIEKLGYNNKSLNTNFAHIYNYNDNSVYSLKKDSDTVEEANFDVDKYVWRYEITDEDKIFDENDNFELKNKYDLKVTYYDASHPDNSNYDKVLTKSYVCEDSIFYHDISLDVLGVFYNVPRHVFRQPLFDSVDEELEYYNNTYPQYCNTLTEDDYHYQKRLEYYINNYNKLYFPCLELWKYFHINSELVNRKVIVAEQDYSYMRNLRAEEDKYINELGANKLNSFYSNSNYDEKIEVVSNLQKPKLKSTISSDDYLNQRNGILIDENNEYITDQYGTFVRIDYDYIFDKNTNEYTIKYENASRNFRWYVAKYIDVSEDDDKDVYQIKLTDSLKVVPNTHYRLRFCVKDYPNENMNLRIIYKNNDGDGRDVEESILSEEDYENIEEYNELVYTNYHDEWGIVCEYIYTDFLTLENAQNIEIYLESESEFQISDITLQRVTINHFDSEYMKTSTDYNSCVYDLYANYNEIPSNIRYENLNIFNNILNRSLPLTKTGYFNFNYNDKSIDNNMNLTTAVNIQLDNLLEVESGIINKKDYANVNTKTNDVYEYKYSFNKYIKKGEYEIWIKPYKKNINNIISDINIFVDMIIFNENNTAQKKTLELTIDKTYETFDENGKFFKILFINESDNSFDIRINYNESFSFKDFKLKRKFPLTIEEITK